jgi:hypothetical protein
MGGLNQRYSEAFVLAQGNIYTRLAIKLLSIPIINLSSKANPMGYPRFINCLLKLYKVRIIRVMPAGQSKSLRQVWGYFMNLFKGLHQFYLSLVRCDTPNK